jgi:hypothetical protein
MTSSDSSWSGSTLVFNTIITTVGNAYNPSTGIFTAPTQGNYVFFVNVQGYSNQYIYVDIVLNGSTKVRTMAYGDSNNNYNAGPNLVALTLQKGDRVWIKRFSGLGYYINGPIGFLI